MPGKRGLTVFDRLWARVVKTDGCWEWQGCTRQGYGVLGLGGRGTGVETTHRISWEATNGPIPEGLCVLHRCDNRRCVRPDHLFLGDRGDNMRDCLSKGRANRPRGERHPKAKLTEEQVREMRRLFAAGVSKNKLSTLYPVGRTQVRQIVEGLFWAHVR